MAFTTSKGRTHTSLSEINVTPFVDVVLVLLIIFMVTAPVLESGIEVDLPKTKTVKAIATEKVVVTIDKRQTLYVGNDPVNINLLDPPSSVGSRERQTPPSSSGPTKRFPLGPLPRWWTS